MKNGKSNFGFSYTHIKHHNIANSEEFRWNFSSSINFFFLKSEKEAPCTKERLLDTDVDDSGNEYGNYLPFIMKIKHVYSYVYYVI